MKPHWRWPALLLLALGIGFLVAMPLYESPLLIFLHDHLARLEKLIAENYAITLTGYIAVYVTSIALSFPAAMTLTLIGGCGFGILVGGFAAVSSATLGGLMAFLAARALSRDWSRKIGRFDLSRMIKTLQEDAASYLIFLRLMPIFPFWLVNLSAAIAGVPLATFLWTTFLGVMPAAFTFATAGEALAGILDRQWQIYHDCVAAGLTTCSMRLDRAGIVDKRLIVAIATLGGLALIPVAIRRIGPLARFCRRRGWMRPLAPGDTR